jgi:hypothetical protein
MIIIIIIITHKPMCNTVYTIRVMATNTYFENETLLCEIKFMKMYFYTVYPNICMV